MLLGSYDLMLVIMLVLMLWTVAYVAAICLGWREIMIILIVLVVPYGWLCVVRSIGRGSSHSDSCVEDRRWCDINNIPCVAVLFLQFRI